MANHSPGNNAPLSALQRAQAATRFNLNHASDGMLTNSESLERGNT
jgi:hypothetical protein